MVYDSLDGGIGMMLRGCWKTGHGVRLFCCAVALALVSGCGGGGVDLGPPIEITGTITLDGQPLPNVEVIFATTEEGVPLAGRRFVAKTGPDGGYKIESIFANTYAVSVMPQDSGADPNAEPDPDAPAETPPNPLSKYGSESELSATVAEGKSTFDFELVSKPVK